jgi:threonine/homoserine/homoserine lactone efflux protein
MSPIEFAFAVAALLLAPGPTNTLLALSGVSAGFARAMRLIPFELAGYLCVIAPLAIFGVAVLASQPMLAEVVKLAAAAWIMLLAFRLWFRAPQSATACVTAPQMFVTTLLNPKGLIFGLVLVPSGGPDALPAYLLIFMVLALAAATIWSTAGGLFAARAQSHSRAPTMLRFAAASWLAFISMGFATSALTGRV